MNQLSQYGPQHHLTSHRGTAGPFAKWASALMPLALLLSGVLSACGAEEPTLTPTLPPVPPTATTALTPTPAFTEPAYWPTGAWRTSTPEEQGVDSAKLLVALQHIQDAGINVRTITVIRNGYVVLEAANQPFTLDMSYDVKSVTKSMVGALFGIAIHEGYIKDVKQTVLSYFPELTIANRDKDKDALTLEDLLSMQPGLDCADDKLNGEMEASKDWVHFALDLPMASPGGQKLVYCTAGPHILSAILTRATGMSTAEYAQSRLFGPLGIAPGSTSWGTDPQGVTLGGYGLSVRPLDMAKLGLLYLSGGKWEGKQIVPQDWVAASTTTHALGDNDKNYGYLFWLYPNHFAAEGYGEQKIMVVKDRNMLVIMTSAIDWHKGPALERLLQDYIIPTTAPDVPLPANAASLADLQAKVKYLANPVQPVQPLPEAAKRISGQTFIFADNPLGWKTLTLNFRGGNPEAQAIVVAANGESTITDTVPIGMDNVYRLSTGQGGNIVGRRGSWVDDHTLLVRQLQSNPDIQETEIRVEISGDILKAHAQEMVFDTYMYDVQGTISTHPATTTPVATPIPPQVPAILIPEQGKQVMLPLHMLARLGQPGEQITADLVWQDGTKLSHFFTLLKGEDGRGLLAANLDWVNMLQPPEPKTQPATLYLRDAGASCSQSKHW